MNGLAYAYLGDAVFELEVREYLISKGMTRIDRLHKTAIKFTSAIAQSTAIKGILDELSEEELRFYKLGRNSGARQAKKTASMIDYKMATGLESLVGYLYLNNPERMRELVKKIIKTVEV